MSLSTTKVWNYSLDTIKTRAIVLSSIDYKEKDKLVTLFSLEYGIISAKLKSVKAFNAKLKFAKEPFCFGEFLIQKPANVITSVEVIDTFYDVTKSLEKFYNACAIIEIVKKVIQAGEINQPLFVSTLKALSTICYENKHDYALAKFMVEILEAMGYQFTLDKCSECGQNFVNKKWLNLDYGEIVCNACRSQSCIEISNKCHSALKILKSTEYEKLKTISLAKGSEKECLEILCLNFKNRFNIDIKLI